MEWWEWIVLVAILGTAGAGLVTMLVRSTLRGRRFLRLSHGARIQFGRRLLQDPAISLPARIAMVVLVGYLLLPFDIIPDFIPVIGMLDDAAVALAAIAVLVALIPREAFEMALTEAEGGDVRTVNAEG
jgi:uncharacterized membrane protein YkvA (DUF1232 family)